MTWLNRYQHKMTLTMRVWPDSSRTHDAAVKGTEYKVDGMRYTANCRMAVTHRYGKAYVEYYSWELSKQDGDRLCSIGAAGARIDAMRVKCPGSMLTSVKQECWLEVEVTVYPHAIDNNWMSKGNLLHGKEDEMRPRVEELWASDWERNRKWVKRHYGYAVLKYRAWLETWEQERRTFTGVHYIMHKELIDIPLMARKIMEGKIVVIDWRLHQNYQVQMANIYDKLNYYVEPGRKPDEPGGEFMGYCLGRSVFWGDGFDVPPEVKAEGDAAVAAYREEEKREKFRRKVRQHFVEAVTTRVATFYGVSRETVMARFIEVGYVDWISERADEVAATYKPNGKGVDAMCKGPAGEATKVLKFCIDAMAIRPPDPPPVILDTKRQKAKIEYQRKKEDAFNALPPEEQQKVLAKREKRQRGTPQGLLKRIVARLVEEGGGDADAIMAELTAEGVTDLILNAIRTQEERRGGRAQGEGQEAIVRVGAKAVKVFRQCKTGALVESWNADRLIR